MNRAAVAIFVKTPGYSPVKTRLAREIGEEQAVRVYRQLLAIVEQRVLEAAGVDGYFAVAEREAADDPLWRLLPVMSQGEGGLGTRLAKIYTELLQRYTRVVLIGADCPELTTELVLEAATPAPHFLIGPATDGGFYLFAGSTPLPASLWEGVQYSVASTAAQLIDGLAPFGMVKLLPPLADLDTLDDLNRVKEIVGGVASPAILGD